MEQTSHAMRITDEIRFRDFLDRLTYPSQKYASKRFKQSWVDQMDNTLINAEETLALLIARDKGSTFSGLPENMRKNMELYTREELQFRLVELYATAKTKHVLSGDFNPTNEMLTFIRNAEEAADVLQSPTDPRKAASSGRKQGRKPG